MPVLGVNLWRLWFNWPETTPPDLSCLKSFRVTLVYGQCCEQRSCPAGKGGRRPCWNSNSESRKPCLTSGFWTTVCPCLSPHHFLCNMLCMGLISSSRCHFRKKKNPCSFSWWLSNPVYLSVSDFLCFYFLLQFLLYHMTTWLQLNTFSFYVSWFPPLLLTVPFPGRPEEGSKCLCPCSFNRECFR